MLFRFCQGIQKTIGIFSIGFLCGNFQTLFFFDSNFLFLLKPKFFRFLISSFRFCQKLLCSLQQCIFVCFFNAALGKICQKTLAAVLKGCAVFFFQFFQFFLECQIKIRMEHPTENGATFHTIRIKEFQEFPLGNHGNLFELFCVNAQQCFRRFFYFFCAGHYIAVRIPKDSICCFFCGAFPGFFGTQIGRVSQNTICFPAMGESQIHKSFRGRRSKVTAQTIYLTVGAADLSKKSKTNGVKQCCFSGTCIPCNEEDPLFSQFRKRNLHTSRIRAKGGNSNFQRFHSATPPKSCQIFSTRAFCVSLISLSFCFSKKPAKSAGPESCS